MSEQADQFQRTEEPTQKRLDDARGRGDAPKSQEIVTVVLLGAAGLALWLFAGAASAGLARMGAAFLDHPHEFATDAGALQRLFAAVATQLSAIMAAIALLFVAAAFLANIGQARPVFTTARLEPKLSKLSPLEGAKRIFGPQGLFNFLKGLFKIVIVGGVLVYALWPDRSMLVGLVHASGRELLHLAAAETEKLLMLTVAAMAIIAALDYAHQRRQWMQRLRMTKEEVKRELRESEGDPLIKGRLRRGREARLRRRMLVAVKDATVLVMNPTHFAVALKYETGAKAAPICIAKGADEVALRMRDVANENGVPVVENPPLARALFAAADLDREIPIEHYEAVAKVIGFIMKKAEEAKSQR
jgi:flagellar biosynthetic protein FlhB